MFVRKLIVLHCLQRGGSIVSNHVNPGEHVLGKEALAKGEVRE